MWEESVRLPSPGLTFFYPFVTLPTFYSGPPIGFETFQISARNENAALCPMLFSRGRL